MCTEPALSADCTFGSPELPVSRALGSTPGVSESCQQLAQFRQAGEDQGK